MHYLNLLSWAHNHFLWLKIIVYFHHVLRGFAYMLQYPIIVYAFWGYRAMSSLSFFFFFYQCKVEETTWFYENRREQWISYFLFLSNSPYQILKFFLYTAFSVSCTFSWGHNSEHSSWRYMCLSLCLYVGIVHIYWLMPLNILLT